MLSWIRSHYKFYPRVVNETNIRFTNEELTLLNNGLKYNLGHKPKQWMKDLGLEPSCPHWSNVNL